MRQQFDGRLRGGTDMDVYLRGDEVRKLDWWVEKVTLGPRGLFHGVRPVLVIETIERKYDFTQSRLPKPMVSRTRYRLDRKTENAPIKEFLDHAEFPVARFSEEPFFISPVYSPTHLTSQWS